ncbi:MAG: esterase [Bacteroidetes bacterium RIFCSPLOWO2_12_FULL_35_15]|nr:MAG: esterase [Bacteroidetes bacterium RIFCSPLOWO2_12_FULL_35_15]
MSIWFKPYVLEDIKWTIKNTLAEAIGIELTELTENSLKCSMPVSNKTKQSMGILHGGASAALAETLGSIASNLIVDYNKYVCVGLDINANHLRSVKSGFVYAEAKPIHIGKKTHVWGIEITNEEGKLVCISRLTMAVLSAPSDRSYLGNGPQQ